MSPDDVKAVALQFVDRINHHDIGGIVDMMTENHMLIISGEIDTEGKGKMQKAWKYYFDMFPDYTIKPSHVVVNGGLVVIVGRSDGTITELGRKRLTINGELPPYEEYQGPGIWAAGVKEEKIAVWAVYEDNDKNREGLGV